MAAENTSGTLPPLGPELTYGLEHTRLGRELSGKFIQTAPDATLAEFLASCRQQRAGFFKTLAFRGLSRWLSDYDAYGYLRMYRMHLLSTEQWQCLLGRAPGQASGVLLDIGAGDGGVTHFAQPLFERVCATESARSLARVLSRRGIEVVNHDLGKAPWPRQERFEVVSLLNVLDRTMYPRTLLQHAKAVLAPGGTLLISLPLPMRAHVHVGPHTVAPRERMPGYCDGFEANANAIARQLLMAEGLAIQRLTRLPYLSQGDRSRPFYVLDAAVFACSAAHETDAGQP